MLHLLLTEFPLSGFILLGIGSLLIGSLLNVIIYRLPIMLQHQWQAECQLLLHHKTTPEVRLNLWLPRSFCPECKSTIPFWHNIPILSYCLLRGRCVFCRTSIPMHYPLIELLCVILSLLAGLTFGFTPQLIPALLFIWFMICISSIDRVHQLIPDGLSLGLLWIGLIANTNELFTTLSDAVLSAAGAYFVLWLFIQLFYLVTKKIGMGHGDFKLFAACGAYFGWKQLPFILLISATSGAIIGLAYLKYTGKSKDTPIPFGPFICFAGLCSLFYGPKLLSWYLSLI